MKAPVNNKQASLLHNFDEFGYLYIRVINAVNVRFGSDATQLQANPNEGIPINNATPLQPYPWRGPVYVISDADGEVSYECPGNTGPPGYRRGGR